MRLRLLFGFEYFNRQKRVDKSINQSKTVTTVGNKKELVAVKRNNFTRNGNTEEMPKSRGFCDHRVRIEHIAKRESKTTINLFVSF